MTIAETVAKIDRKNCIAENTDPTGKKWVVKHINATALYVARPEPDRQDAVIPAEMRGKWTQPSVIQAQIELYLGRAWDKAEAAQAKSDRKAAVTEAPEVATEDLPLVEAQSVDVPTEPDAEAQADADAAIAEMLATEEKVEDARTSESQESLPTESGA